MSCCRHAELLLYNSGKYLDEWNNPSWPIHKFKNKALSFLSLEAWQTFQSAELVTTSGCSSISGTCDEEAWWYSCISLGFISHFNWRLVCHRWYLTPGWWSRLTLLLTITHPGHLTGIFSLTLKSYVLLLAGGKISKWSLSFHLQIIYLVFFSIRTPPPPSPHTHTHTLHPSLPPSPPCIASLSRTV